MLKTKKILSLVLFLIGGLFVFFAFFNIQKTEIKSNPQPKTELAKIIGESIQATPQDWDCNISTYSSSLCFITLTNNKCSYYVDYSIGYYGKDDIVFSSSGFTYTKQNTSTLILSEEDTKYLNYQVDKYLKSFIENEKREQAIKDSIIISHQNDSLRTIYTKELKNCL